MQNRILTELASKSWIFNSRKEGSGFERRVNRLTDGRCNGVLLIRLLFGRQRAAFLLVIPSGFAAIRSPGDYLSLPTPPALRVRPWARPPWPHPSPGDTNGFPRIGRRDRQTQRDRDRDIDRDRQADRQADRDKEIKKIDTEIETEGVRAGEGERVKNTGRAGGVGRVSKYLLRFESEKFKQLVKENTASFFP